jgi:hypothetical protein
VAQFLLNRTFIYNGTKAKNSGTAGEAHQPRPPLLLPGVKIPLQGIKANN